MHHHSSTWSDVLSFLAILTSMFGIFMTHTLAQSRERAKAHADNVKAGSPRIANRAGTIACGGDSVGNPKPRLQKPVENESPEAKAQKKAVNDEYIEATTLFHSTLQDRLFIAGGDKALEIESHWKRGAR
jgi:hypothetical protein